MLKRTFLFITLSSLVASVSFAEKAQGNVQGEDLKVKNALSSTSIKMPEKYPTQEEIEKLMRIHFPDDWAKKQTNESKQQPKKTATQTATPPIKAPSVKAEPDTKRAKETIRVRQISVGKTTQQKLNEHRASDTQKLAINTKYTYNPKLYTMLPNEVKNIGLMGRVNSSSVGSLRIYRDVSSKTFADAYFQSHQLHSELFSAYLARKITLNDGVIGENVTLFKAFIDELGYKFSSTPVHSVRSAHEAEEKYLYILLRLTPGDRIQFWKYINTMRTGNAVNLPGGITIADVLTAEL